jgi:hypothetical protein
MSELNFVQKIINLIYNTLLKIGLIAGLLYLGYRIIYG